MKVEFGAGGSRPNGWITHDMEVDIRNSLPYQDGQVTKIRAEHVAEHQSGPQLLRFLDECHRILKPGGSLRLCMPVLDRLNREEARDITLNHGHEASYSTTLIKKFLWMAGFNQVAETGRDPLDHHHLVIGTEKDNNETARFLAIK